MSSDSGSAGRLTDVPVVIHVGLHKTGTSWLQHTVFRPGAGKRFAYCEDRRLLRGAFVVPSQRAFSAAAALEGLAEPIEAARRTGQPLLLVDEILAALPFNNRFLRDTAADRLAATFPNARILITIREQEAIILSSYGHYVRGGNSASLEGFLARPTGDQRLLWNGVLDWEHFDYEALLDGYEARFGAGKVLLLPLEWMTRNEAAMRAKLQDWAGLDLAERGDVPASARVNPASSALAYVAMRHLNRLVAHDTRWQKRPVIRPQSVAHWVNRLTPKALEQRMAARWKASVRAAAGDTYRASNARVAERIGIDLAALGYKV